MRFTIKNGRLWVLGMCAALPMVLWLAWPDDDPSMKDDSSTVIDGISGPRAQAPVPADDRSVTGSSRTTRDRQRQGSGETALLQVDRLLSNATLEDEYVIAQLRDIAGDPRLSLSARTEAMAHGLLLNAPAFADLAEQPDLPEDLAAELLGRAINFNESPMMQIEVYMNLMSHASPGIREEALENLRFMVEDDFDEADASELVRLANEKLVALRAAAPTSSD